MRCAGIVCDGRCRMYGQSSARKDANMSPKRPEASRPGKLHRCEPFSKVLVSAFAPGTRPARVNCTSSTDFLVYCSTNNPSGGPGYAVSVKSTGAGIGTGSPVFIVGGVPNDIITITMEPGTTSFITLQTMCNAKASITSVPM